MRKIVIYIAAFVLMCSIGLTMAKHAKGYASYNSSPYKLAFAAIGVNSLECRFDCWAKIRLKTDLRLEFENNLDFICNALQIYIVPESIVEAENQILASISTDQVNYTIKLNQNGPDEALIHINIISKADADLHAIEKNIEHLISNENFDWKTNLQYSGSDNTVLTDKSRDTIFNVFANNLQADPIAVFKENSFLSATCRSVSLNKNTQMQIAIKSNENKNKFIVMLGIPFILSDY